MPTRFRPYQPKQMLMLPPDLREWVPEGHLAHQVSELVDGLELGAFYRPYEEDGRRNCPYEPRMMVKVSTVRLKLEQYQLLTRLGAFVLQRESLKYLIHRDFFEQGDAENLQDFSETAVDFQFLFENGHE